MKRGLLKRVALVLVELFISIAGLWFVFHDPHTRSQIAGAFRESDKRWLMLGLAGYGAVEVLAAVRWQLLLRMQDVAFRWRQVFAIVMVGLFFNMFLPGLVGGDAMRLYLGSKLARRRTLQIALSIVMDRLLGLFSILFLAAVIITLRLHWFERAPVSVHILYLAIALLGLGFGACVLLFLGVGAGLIQKLPKKAPFRKQIVGASDALKVFLAAPRKLTALFFLTITSHLAYYSTYACAVQSLQSGASHPSAFISVVSIMPVVNTITSIPVSVGGLGVRETLFQQLLSNLADVPPALAAFGASLGFAIQAAWGALGAATYALWRKRA